MEISSGSSSSSGSGSGSGSSSSTGRNGREQVSRSLVHPDLERERQNCPFSQEELTNFLEGGPEKTAERRSLEKYIFGFFPKVLIYFLNNAQNIFLY